MAVFGISFCVLRAISKWFFVSLVIFLSACASPAKINDQLALSDGFTKSILKGGDFSHVVYSKPGRTESPWHIYIEGDGRPWSSRYRIASDPTVARPLMLRLIRKESASVIYLGRPCYLGLISEPKCQSHIWTHGRYSEQVVLSMEAALKYLIGRHDIRDLVLLGHSGGGALAMLLAERIPQTHAVVTIAGNLDIDAWALKQGYSSLVGSLNPAERPALDSAIAQFHFRGKIDNNLPSSFKEAIFGDSILIEDVGHTLGWEDVFCDVLTRIGGSCRDDQQ